MNLIGKFFFHWGNEYSQSGEVLAEAAPGLIFIRCDVQEKPSRLGRMIMIQIDELCTTKDKDGELEPAWEFFDTREELDGFLRFLDDVDEKVDEAKTSGPHLVN